MAKKIKTSMRGERVGIFALDPGLTSGIAYCDTVVQGDTAETLLNLNVDQIKCYGHDYPDFMMEAGGAEEIAQLWLDLVFEWTMDGIPQTRQFFIYEDFNLRGPIGSTQRAGISPVRVTSLIQGMLIKHKPIYVPQQPGMAKSRWTNDRLKRAGLWTVGLEHGRDATRHAALWVAAQF